MLVCIHFFFFYIISSQAVVADRTVYVSGCLGMDKTTMQLVPGGAAAQTEMALKNLEAILIAAGSGIDKVVKNSVFLKDLNDFGEVNEAYKKGTCFAIACLSTQTPLLHNFHLAIDY